MMSTTIEPTINNITQFDHTLVDNVFFTIFISFYSVLVFSANVVSEPIICGPDCGYAIGFYLVFLLMNSSLFAPVFLKSFGACYVLGYIGSVYLAGFAVLAVVTIIFGYKRTSNEISRGSNVIPLASVQDFKNLVANRDDLDHKNESVDMSIVPINNISLTVPFQLAEYGCLHLYSHHKIVTGWIETNDDILFTTVEYEGANWRDFVRGTCLRSCKIYWGQIRIMAGSLKEQLNKKRFTCVIPTEPTCVEYCRCPTCKHTNDLIELEIAKDKLWQDENISTIQEQMGSRQPNIIEIKQMLEMNTSRTMNKDLFRFVATRAASLIERDSVGWKLSFNNCEHLANYLMSGVVRSKQLETAHFWQRLLLHGFGPLVEGIASCRILLLFVMHTVVFFVSAYFANTAYLYALCVPVAFTVEFCQAGWDISTLIGYDGSTRMGVVVVIQKILNSTLNGFAILLGIGLSQQENKCLPFYLDGLIIATVLFLNFQCVVYPLYAIAFDKIAYKTDYWGFGILRQSLKARIGRFFTNLSVFMTIVMIPIFILYPFWLELRPMLHE